MAYSLTYSYDSTNQSYSVSGYSGITTSDKVVIPATYNDGTNGSHPVTSIGAYAIEYCSSLTSVTMLSTTPPTIESSTFPSGFSGTITVPAGTGDAYKAATKWSKYADKIQEAAA